MADARRLLLADELLDLAARKVPPASRGRSRRAASLMSRAPRPSRLAFSHESRRRRSTASASGQ
jgi:hypothetical protein